MEKALSLKKLNKKQLKMKREKQQQKTKNLSNYHPTPKYTDLIQTLINMVQPQLLPKINTILLSIILKHKTNLKSLWKRNTCIIKAQITYQILIRVHANF